MTDVTSSRFRLRWRPAIAARMTWTIASALAVEFVVIGLSAVPGALLFQAAWHWAAPGRLAQTVAVCLLIAPSYVVFAIGMIVLSAWSTRLFGWRTPPDTEMVVSEVSWDLCHWTRALVSAHLVRALVGSILRATPFWTFYLRLNGARLGRGVYVNSLAVTDHNLLDFGDYVVIGDGAHVSGHTVERGVIKTGRVRLGRGTTIGLESVVGIGVETGPDCQVGALSIVPKYSTLEGGATYVGQPVMKIERPNGRANQDRPPALASRA